MVKRVTKYDKLVVPNLEKIKFERMQGASMEDIAELLGVSRTAVYNWLKEHKEFADAIEEANANMQVSIIHQAHHSLLDKLRDRMMIAEQIVENGVIVKEKRKLIPADTTAIIFALKARDPEAWDPLGVARLKEKEHEDDLNKQILESLNKYKVVEIKPEVKKYGKL